MGQSQLWQVYLVLALATDGLALALAGTLWLHGAAWYWVALPPVADALLRTLFVAHGFRTAWRLRPRALAAAYPHGALQALRTIARETLALWRMFSLLMPLPFGSRRDRGWGVPILFVHGFICNAGVWRPLMRALARRTGAPLRAISLYPAFGSINEYAEQLHAAVEAIRQQTRIARIMLVGHSMGGLVIRRYLRAYGADRVCRVVTLGSPHHGVFVPASLARLGENLRQMKHGSAWLAALNADEDQPCPVPILSVWSPHDNLIPPQDGARLRYPNARERILPGEAHDTLLFSPVVADLLVQEWNSSPAEPLTPTSASEQRIVCFDFD